MSVLLPLFNPIISLSCRILQGGEDGEVGNTKRISILSPEDPSVEGVAVESEVQEDERKPEPPQPGKWLHRVTYACATCCCSVVHHFTQ